MEIEKAKEIIEDANSYLIGSCYLDDKDGSSVNRLIELMSMDCGDCYEANVKLILNDGSFITLNNRYLLSSLIGRYKGDSLFFDNNGWIYINKFDNCGSFHQIRVDIGKVTQVVLSSSEFEREYIREIISTIVNNADEIKKHLEIHNIATLKP